MTNLIKFEVDNDLIINLLNAAFKFTEKRAKGIILQFHKEGLHCYCSQPEQISAMMVTASKGNFKGYKRSNDKDKDIKNLSQDFWLEDENIEKIVKFAAVNKEPMQVTITEKNWTLKKGSLTKRFKTEETMSSHNQDAKKIYDLINKFVESVPLAGSISMEEFWRYIRANEVSHRKLTGIYDNKSFITKKKKTVTLLTQLNQDTQEVNFSNIMSCPEGDFKLVFDIREMGQAMKYLRHISDMTLYIQGKEGIPMVLSGLPESPKEDAFAGPINFWYLLAPIIDED